MSEILKVLSNRPLTSQVYEMKLEGKHQTTMPGQFINIKISDLKNHPYLRRPMSVCDYDEDGITIIYKVVGKGTLLLSQKKPGDELDVLTGLGNGFKVEKINNALLAGGGVGIPPLYGLAKKLHKEGITVTTVLGFNSADEIFYQEEFQPFGAVHVCTMDGSYGYHGNVVDYILENHLSYDTYYACGPEKMLLNLIRMDSERGYLSFEARMGCGFGACMGCSYPVKGGYKRICVEGPVLSSREVMVDG